MNNRKVDNPNVADEFLINSTGVDIKGRISAYIFNSHRISAALELPFAMTTGEGLASGASEKMVSI